MGNNWLLEVLLDSIIIKSWLFKFISGIKREYYKITQKSVLKPSNS